MSVTSLNSSSTRFVKGEKPETVKQGEFEYVAGELSLIGRRSISVGVVRSIRQYLRDSYEWSEETQNNATWAAQGTADLLLGDDVILILACDYTEQLKPSDFLEWDEDFIAQCFKLALDLNPRLKRQENPLPTGQAQPETHNEDGTAKTPEETPKN